jgi:HD-GYP domain-containing protein (c-di-GMP phosphodiesterase class II)
LQHSERLDGSGYPKGLAGDAIILQARILAVADTVEAMLTYRPYRPAHSLSAVMSQITDNRGRLYDPQVADACIRLFCEKGFEFKHS